jgi:hypothetical protein
MDQLAQAMLMLTALRMLADRARRRLDTLGATLDAALSEVLRA